MRSRLLIDSLVADVAQAAKETDPNPTADEKESGDYEKGHVKLHGLDIAIENAKGSTRSGVSKDGKKWSVKMPAVYGYIEGTIGKDKDHIDVYIGPAPEAETVYVINQNNDEKKFDEHKCMLGFNSKEVAIETYDKAFNDGKGPQRRASVVEVPMDGFKAWLKDGNKKVPFSQTESLVFSL